YPVSSFYLCSNKLYISVILDYKCWLHLRNYFHRSAYVITYSCGNLSVSVVHSSCDIIVHVRIECVCIASGILVEADTAYLVSLPTCLVNPSTKYPPISIITRDGDLIFIAERTAAAALLAKFLAVEITLPA